MKTIHFKVHSVYTKKDMVRMQKLASRRNRRRTVIALVVVLLMYLFLTALNTVMAGKTISPLSFLPSGALDVILVASMAFTICLMVAAPYFQAHKILKAAPGGELKANLYFYDQTFKYGWGNSFSTVAYMDIQEFRVLDDAFYIKAGGLSYWVKKEDFEMGEADRFAGFIEQKRK